MSTLRDRILADEDLIASKRRFGLFSQLPPLAVCDDSLSKKIEIKRGQNGKPITKSPQILPGLCRTGNTRSSYLHVPSSIYQNDLFKQPNRQQAEYQLKLHSRSTIHDSDFKPSSGIKTLSKAAYPYMDENPQTNRPKLTRDQLGRVKTEPRNFTTNSTFKIDGELFKYIPHYQNKKHIVSQAREQFNITLPEESFIATSHGNKLFSKDSIIYGLDQKAKDVLKSKIHKSKTTKMLIHDAAFKPAVRGNHRDPLGKYPKHIQKQRSEQVVQKQQFNEAVSKQRWVPNNFGLSRPTPSISLHPMNFKPAKYI